MIKKLLLSLVLFCSVFASAATPVYVQSGNANTNSKAYATNTTAGNLLIAVILTQDTGFNGNPMVKTVTDTGSNAWHLAGRIGGDNANQGGSAYVYYAANCVGGADTVSFTATAGPNNTISIFEYSGAGAITPFLTFAGNVATSSVSSLGTNSIVTDSSNTLLLAVAIDPTNTGNTITTPSGFTQRQYYTGSGRFGVYEKGVTATGTYNTTFAFGSSSSNLMTGIFAFQDSATSSRFVQQGTLSTTTATSTTLAVPYPNNIGSGNLLVAVVGNRAAVAPTGIADTRGNTWYLIGCTQSTSDQCMYYAPNSSAGADTVTFTFASAEDIVGIVTEYRGFSTSYAVELSATTGRSGSPVAASVGTFDSTNPDLLVSSVYDENAYRPGFTVSTGFTGRGAQAIVDNDLGSLGVFDNYGTAATYTNSATALNGSTNISQVMVAFRSVIPTFGRIQIRPQTTSTSDTFNFPVRSGDFLVALTRCTANGLDGVTSAPTDTQSNTWIAAPASLDSDSSDEWWVYYVVNAAAGATTVTQGGCSSSPNRGGMWLFEYTGVNTLTPLGASSGKTQFYNSTTLDPGPVSVFSQSIVFSSAFNAAGTNPTYTGTTGFIPLGWYTPGTQSIESWDQIVPAGTYDNAITSSITNQLSAYNLVLSSSAITYVSLRQKRSMLNCGGTGSDCSATGSFISPVVSGDLVVVPTASITSTGTMSDSCGDTFHLAQGGGSNLYAFYWTILGCSGAVTFTNTNINTGGGLEFYNVTTATQDQTNFGTATGTSVSTGSITTTKVNELIVSCVANPNDASNRNGLVSLSAGWSGMGYTAAGHDSAVWCAFKVNAPITSYSNTFTWVSSTVLDAMIVSFNFATTSSSGQTPVSIITDNLEREMEVRFAN